MGMSSSFLMKSVLEPCVPRPPVRLGDHYLQILQPKGMELVKSNFLMGSSIQVQSLVDFWVAERESQSKTTVLGPQLDTRRHVAIFA